MPDSITIAVSRQGRSSERLLHGGMIALAVLFLLGGILGNRGLMLPGFLMAMTAMWFHRVSRKEWEYQLEDGLLRVLRVSDQGRYVLHEIPFSDIRLLCLPSDSAADPYRKGAPGAPKKYDYSSYREDVPYYTLIAEEDGVPEKLLLDLTPEAIDMIRRRNPGAVQIRG